MLIECMEEGEIQWNHKMEDTNRRQWLNVGTVLGEIADGDEEDDEDADKETWTWQAYIHENVNTESEGDGNL